MARTVYSVSWLGCRLADQRTAVRFSVGQQIVLFSKTSRSNLGPTQPLTQWVLGLLPRRWKGRDFKITIHLHLVPRVRMGRNYSSTPPIYPQSVQENKFILPHCTDKYAVFKKVTSVGLITVCINLLKPSGFFTHHQVSCKNSTWCSLCVECFVRISEHTATFALYTINCLVLITVVERVYWAVRTGSLYKADYVSSLKG